MILLKLLKTVLVFTFSHLFTCLCRPYLEGIVSLERQFHKEQLWYDTVKIMTALWTRVNQCIENGATLIEGGHWTKYLMK